MAEDVPDEGKPTAAALAYRHLRDRIVSVQFRPGERINEIAIAAELGISRTPLREALNRLAADGLCVSVPGKGFFQPEINVKEMYDLFDFRVMCEIGAIERSIDKVTDEQIADLGAFIEVSVNQAGERSIPELVKLDEEFHLRLAAYAGNEEIVRTLDNINARVRFVRCINMESTGLKAADHRAILAALAARDKDGCAKLLTAHIAKRLDQISEAVRSCYARIYVDSLG